MAKVPISISIPDRKSSLAHLRRSTTPKTGVKRPRISPSPSLSPSLADPHVGTSIADAVDDLVKEMDEKFSSRNFPFESPAKRKRDDD